MTILHTLFHCFSIRVCLTAIKTRIYRRSYYTCAVLLLNCLTDTPTLRYCSWSLSISSGDWRWGQFCMRAEWAKKIWPTPFAYQWHEREHCTVLARECKLCLKNAPTLNRIAQNYKGRFWWHFILAEIFKTLEFACFSFVGLLPLSGETQKFRRDFAKTCV